MSTQPYIREDDVEVDIELELLGFPDKNGPDETLGRWGTEAESAEEFDLRMQRCHLFTSLKEVSGIPDLRFDQNKKQKLRIDRLLLPTPELLALGWKAGAIGVELKRSGVPIGPPISQMLDYKRTLFDTPNGAVRLGYVFLWASLPSTGTLESIMTHQRVGGVNADQWNLLRFHTGSVQVLTVGKNGKMHMCATASQMGKRSGSR